MVPSAGVVLAGGPSSRMGSPKASLEWHGSTLLRRPAGIVALAAAYRTGLAPLAERLVAGDQLRPALLLDQCAVTRLDEAALRADPVLAALDPGLDSLVNLNEPADYRAARARPAPEVTLQPLG